MNNPSLKSIAFATLFIAVCAYPVAVSAQNTYKCGNTYSQTPCPDASLLEPADKRSGTQKSQVESAAARTRQAADNMERDRLAQEKRDLAGQRGAGAVVISPAAPPESTSAGPVVLNPPKKGRKGEFFVAQIPGESKADKAKKLKAEKAASRAAAKKAKADAKAATKAEKASKSKK
jgi:hypothetical protein